MTSICPEHICGLFGCMSSRLVISMSVCALSCAERNSLQSSGCRCCIGSSPSRHSSYDPLPSLSIRTDLGIEISHPDLHIVPRNFIHDPLQLFVEVVFLA